jgi:hypothetical protein
METRLSIFTAGSARETRMEYLAPYHNESKYILPYVAFVAFVALALQINSFHGSPTINLSLETIQTRKYDIIDL